MEVITATRLLPMALHALARVVLGVEAAAVERGRNFKPARRQAHAGPVIVVPAALSSGSRLALCQLSLWELVFYGHTYGVRDRSVL